MNFVSPSLLWFLACLSIPIIIHLFYFRKTKTILFSHTQFLQNIQYKYAGRRNIKNLLLLLLRCLLFIFLIIAFAYPYFTDKAIYKNASTCIIYVDNSYDMSLTHDAEALLDRAKERAGQIVQYFDKNTEFIIMANDFSFAENRLLNKDEVLPYLSKIEANGAPRNIADILSKIDTAIKKLSASNPIVYFISSFQSNMQEKYLASFEYPLQIIAEMPDNKRNISIDSIWFSSPVLRENELQKMVFRMTNHSDEAIKNNPIEIFLNDELKGSSVFDLPPNTSVVDTLLLGNCALGWNRVRLETEGDLVDFDNIMYGTFEIKDHYKVLVINAESQNPYLNAFFDSNPFFQVTQNNLTGIDYDQLNDYPFIILHGLNNISSGLQEALKNYLSQGNGLALIPDISDMDDEKMKDVFTNLSIDYPMGLRKIEERALGQIDFQNPFFDHVFEENIDRINMPTVSQYYVFSKEYAAQSNVLLHINDDAILSQYNHELGRVYLFSIPFHTDFSNFPEHALFVPVLYKMLLFSGALYPHYLTIQADNYLKINNKDVFQSGIPHIIKDDYEIIPDLRRNARDTYLYFSDQIKEAGIYEINFSNDNSIHIAFNENRSESVLKYMDKDAVLFHMNAPNARFLDDKKYYAHHSDNMIVREAFPLWKWFLLLALITFLLEWAIVLWYDKIFKPEQVL